MIVDKIICPDDVNGRNVDVPQQAVIEMQFLSIVYLKGRERADEDGALKRRRAVRMLFGMMGQEARREGPSVREAEDAVEGTFLFDGLHEKVIGLQDRLFVILDRPWPVIEAEVWTFVESANAGTWRRFDFSLNVVEGGGVVFLEFTSERAFDNRSVTFQSFSRYSLGLGYLVDVSGSVCAHMSVHVRLKWSVSLTYFRIGTSAM